MRTTSFTLDVDPLADDIVANPYPWYARLRAEAPVHHDRARDLWLVSRHADVRAVMADAATFSNEAMEEAVLRPTSARQQVLDDQPEPDDGAVSIIGTDGATHARLRRIVNRGFTPRRIAALEDDARAAARRFLPGLDAVGAVDFQAQFAVPYPTVVIAGLLGVDADLHHDFRRWSEHMVRAVFDEVDEEAQIEVTQSLTEMIAWLDEVIDRRSHMRGDDLVSVLMAAELDGGALTHSEMITFVFTLLVAGSITTAYLLGNAMLAVFEQNDLWERLRAAPALVPAFIEEVLRYDAPTQMMYRTATHDVAVAGETIPKGATVAALLGSANHDRSVFEDPNRFDLTRDSREHLAFGHGVHHCLGAALARLEARVALEELVRHIDHLEPTGPVSRVRSVVFRGPTVLPIAASAAPGLTL